MFLPMILALTSILILPTATASSPSPSLNQNENPNIPRQLEVRHRPQHTFDSDPPSDTCVWVCRTTCYWLDDVQAAMREGHKLQASGQGEDPNGYPHQYENHEQFEFPTPGPYYEFPILGTYEIYKGGDPGPDRVVFDGDGQLEGVITHDGNGSDTGSGSGSDDDNGGGFVMCEHDA